MWLSAEIPLLLVLLNLWKRDMCEMLINEFCLYSCQYWSAIRVIYMKFLTTGVHILRDQKALSIYTVHRSRESTYRWTDSFRGSNCVSSAEEFFLVYMCTVAVHYGLDVVYKCGFQWDVQTRLPKKRSMLQCCYRSISYSHCCILNF